MNHPARFSPEIVRVLVDLIRDLMVVDRPSGRISWLHDPFAGDGERLAEIARQCGAFHSGSEIEPEFIKSPCISEGDATDPTTYPRVPYYIVTSPVYPNGMADSWEAKDGSKRFNYRWALAQITGVDRQLHANNMGRYGYRGRGQKSKMRAEYWRIADEAVACWGGATACLVNASDFIYKKHGAEHVEPVVGDWKTLLALHGWHRQIDIPVGTRRMGQGENRDVRVGNEMIIIATKENP